MLLQLGLSWIARKGALTGGADFSALYSAGQMVRQGMGRQLYNIASQKQIQSVLYPKLTTRKGLLLYDHPPFEALLFLPLAYVSYAAAYCVWALINILLLFLSYRLLSPYLRELKPVWKLLPSLIFFAFFPAFVAVLQGQDSALLLFIFALAYVNLKRGHELRSGFFLALGLFKFQFVLPFLVPFVLWRRWKFLGGVLASLLVLFLLSLPVAGFKGTLSYASFLFRLIQGLSSQHVQQALGILPNTMPNIRGIIDVLGPSLTHSSYQKPAIILLSLIAMLWVAKKWRLNRSLSERTFDMGFGLAIVVSVLVSYHVQVHDMSLLLIPIGLALNHSLKNPSEAGPRHSVLYGLVSLFFLSPLYLLLIKQQELYLFFFPILFLGIVLSRQIPSPMEGEKEPPRRNPPDSVAQVT